MCMVSVVMDYGRRVQPNTWTPQSFGDFQEIIRRLDLLDKKLGEPECHDPQKATWMAEIERRLAALEVTTHG